MKKLLFTILCGMTALSFLPIQAHAQINTNGEGDTYVGIEEMTIVEEKTPQDNQIFENVEVMPQFPEIKNPDGTLLRGMDALQNFIINNLHYPAIAEENGIEGRVVSQFIVEKDGKIVDIKVAKTSYTWTNATIREKLEKEQRERMESSLEKEAVRLIKSMPAWYPGLQKGKPVRVRFTLPLSFKLQ